MHHNYNKLVYIACAALLFSIAGCKSGQRIDGKNDEVAQTTNVVQNASAGDRGTSDVEAAQGMNMQDAGVVNANENVDNAEQVGDVVKTSVKTDIANARRDFLAVRQQIIEDNARHRAAYRERIKTASAGLLEASDCDKTILTESEMPEWTCNRASTRWVCKNDKGCTLGGKLYAKDVYLVDKQPMYDGYVALSEPKDPNREADFCEPCQDAHCKCGDIRLDKGIDCCTTMNIYAENDYYMVYDNVSKKWNTIVYSNESECKTPNPNGNPRYHYDCIHGEWVCKDNACECPLNSQLMIKPGLACHDGMGIDPSACQQIPRPQNPENYRCLDGQWVCQGDIPCICGNIPITDGVACLDEVPALNGKKVIPPIPWFSFKDDQYLCLQHLGCYLGDGLVCQYGQTLKDGKCIDTQIKSQSIAQIYQCNQDTKLYGVEAGCPKGTQCIKDTENIGHCACSGEVVDGCEVCINPAGCIDRRSNPIVHYGFGSSIGDDVYHESMRHIHGDYKLLTNKAGICSHSSPADACDAYHPVGGIPKRIELFGTEEITPYIFSTVISNDDDCLGGTKYCGDSEIAPELISGYRCEKNDGDYMLESNDKYWFCGNDICAKRSIWRNNHWEYSFCKDDKCSIPVNSDDFQVSFNKTNNSISVINKASLSQQEPVRSLNESDFELPSSPSDIKQVQCGNETCGLGAKCVNEQCVCGQNKTANMNDFSCIFSSNSAYIGEWGGDEIITGEWYGYICLRPEGCNYGGLHWNAGANSLGATDADKDYGLKEHVNDLRVQSSESSSAPKCMYHIDGDVDTTKETQCLDGDCVVPLKEGKCGAEMHNLNKVVRAYIHLVDDYNQFGEPGATIEAEDSRYEVDVFFNADNEIHLYDYPVYNTKQCADGTRWCHGLDNTPLKVPAVDEGYICDVFPIADKKNTKAWICNSNTHCTCGGALCPRGAACIDEQCFPSIGTSGEAFNRYIIK